MRYSLQIENNCKYEHFALRGNYWVWNTQNTALHAGCAQMLLLKNLVWYINYVLNKQINPSVLHIKKEFHIVKCKQLFLPTRQLVHNKITSFPIYLQWYHHTMETGSDNLSVKSMDIYLVLHFIHMFSIPSVQRSSFENMDL